MITAALIRHGETALNARKCYQGKLDLPLADTGRRKLYQADKPVLTPQRLYVSPLLRARETAEILYPGREQTAIPDLAEMDFGDFDGKNFQDMEHDAAYRAWVDGMCRGKCPGGESRDEFIERTFRAFLQILEDEYRLQAGADRAEDTGPAGEKPAAEDSGLSGQPPAAEDMILPEEWTAAESSGPAGQTPAAEDAVLSGQKPAAEDAALSENHIAIVAHGGTQMAVLYSLRRDKDFYEWQVPPGQGYLLTLERVRPYHWRLMRDPERTGY